MASTTCVSCAVANGDIKPLGGDVARTAHFNVSQDVEYKIPGFMIVASNRHFKHLDEMTREESHDFIGLVHRVRAAQRAALAIEEVYYFYNEDTRHHFHLWMIPRTPEMAQFGRSLECVAPALAFAKKNAAGDEAIKIAAAKLRAKLI